MDRVRRFLGFGKSPKDGSSKSAVTAARDTLSAEEQQYLQLIMDGQQPKNRNDLARMTDIVAQAAIDADLPAAQGEHKANLLAATTQRKRHPNALSLEACEARKINLAGLSSGNPYGATYRALQSRAVEEAKAEQDEIDDAVSKRLKAPGVSLRSLEEGAGQSLEDVAQTLVRNNRSRDQRVTARCLLLKLRQAKESRKMAHEVAIIADTIHQERFPMSDATRVELGAAVAITKTVAEEKKKRIDKTKGIRS